MTESKEPEVPVSEPASEDGGKKNRDVFVARARSLTNIIATTVALVGALTALIRPQSTRATQVSYEELTRAVETLSTQQMKQHDYMVALKTYVELQTNRVLAEVPTVIPVTVAAAPPPPRPVAVVGRPTPTSAPSSMAMAAPKKIDPPPPPPDPGPAPKPVEPEKFEKVLDKAKL